MRIHSYIPCSEVNGPGRRFVLWLQGCAIRCPGCWNKETWHVRGGTDMSLCDIRAAIYDARDQYEITGLTLTGGEPLDQYEEVARLLGALYSRDPKVGMSLGMFTGYSWGEIQDWPEVHEAVSYLDWLVCGPYQEDKACEMGLISSLNQDLKLLSFRHRRDEFCLEGREWETHIGEDGLVRVTGFPPQERP